MDIVIGVEKIASPELLPVIDLVRRLDFAGARLDLTHVVPLSVYAGWPAEPMLSGAVMAELERAEEEEAIRILDQIAERAAGSADGCRRTVLHGSPAERLMAHADEIGAEIVAVNASHHGALTAWLTGSVARGLVIGAHQSVLIAKSSRPAEAIEAHPDAPVRVVFATDHSHYADQCVHELLRFAPRGIEHLTILSAYPADRLTAVRGLVSELAVDPAEAVRQALQKKNDALVPLLQPFAKTLETLVVPGNANEAIAQVMEETNADLLAIGARGHGLLDRLTLGSVSLHQALAASYSVLVLRI